VTSVQTAHGFSIDYNVNWLRRFVKLYTSTPVISLWPSTVQVFPDLHHSCILNSVFVTQNHITSNFCYSWFHFL
jgi:hypothetical protein